MPLFHATATIFSVHEDNKKQLERATDQFQITEMRAAMREFLKACLPRIPIRTGFLRSAFKPMKDFFQGGSDADLNPALVEIFHASPKTARNQFRKFKSHPFKDQGDDKQVLFSKQPFRPDQLQAKERALERELRKSHKRFRKNRANAGKDLRFAEYYYYGRGQRVPKTPANARRFVSPADPSEILSTSGSISQLKFDILIDYYRINDFYSRISGAPWRSLDAGFQASLNYLETAAQRFPLITELLITQRVFLRGDRVTRETVGQNRITDYDYRGRAAPSFHPSSGNIRGAKMDSYPGSATKESLPGMPAPTSKIATQRQQLLNRRKKK